MNINSAFPSSIWVAVRGSERGECVRAVTGLSQLTTSHPAAHSEGVQWPFEPQGSSPKKPYSPVCFFALLVNLLCETGFPIEKTGSRGEVFDS